MPTQWAYHTVCLIDLLGQRAKLTGLERIPGKGRPSADFDTAIKDTAGKLLSFRKLFTDYFESLGQCAVPQFLAALTANQQAQYHRRHDRQVTVERFSDTFVFSTQIPNDFEDSSTISLHRILTACCWAMLISLGDKTPLRGAVTIGAGAVLADGSFYGPALAEVHHLESEVARYPRILLSGNAASFLTDPRPYSRNADISDLMRKMADRSCTLLATDTDGHRIVDYLGKGAHDLYGQSPSHQKAVVLAFDFVRSEAARFREAGDTKHADRYDLLQQYFESRLPLWREASPKGEPL